MITKNVHENKALIKICQNVGENARDRMILDPWNCEKMPQMPLSQNLPENKHVISCDVSIG
jgi:hypothetical protein